MAVVSLVNHTHWNTSANSPATDLRGAKLIVVVIANASAPGSISDDQGNTYIPGTTIVSGVRNMTPFYTIQPTTSATQVVTIVGASFSGASLAAFDAKGAQLVAQSAGNTSAGTTVNTGVINTLGTPNLLIACLGGDGDTSFAIDSAFTIGDTSPYVGGSNLSSSVAYLEQPVAMANNPLWTVGSNGAVICASMLAFTFTGAKSIGSRTRPRPFAPGLAR